MRLILPALALMMLAAGSAHAQAVHRGNSPAGHVTQTVTFSDLWEDGGRGPNADGTLDVLTRVDVVDEPARRATLHALLFGPWGAYLYTYDEERVTPGMPDTTSLRTTLKAIDLDADSAKELLLIERSLTVRTALDETGMMLDEPGPFFLEAKVSLRYLARENGALVEHDLEAEAEAAAVKELLAAELGGPLNAWVQLAAADVDFVKQRFEQARYRYAVVREWAEAQMTGAEINELSPKLPLLTARADDPAVLWLAATRRIGALPRWYQRR